MAWWRERSHPKVGIVVAIIGLLVSFWSIWPWAQRPNDPMQAVYAGHVGDERTQVLLLGMAISVVGIAVFCTSWRLLLVVSAAAIAAFLVARDAIDVVSAVTADDSELVTEVGWALYWIEVAALVGVGVSIVGLWRRALARP